MASRQSHPKEIVYDEGRLIIRRLGTARYIGFRVEHWQTITGTQASYIQLRHDCLEAAERQARAGLNSHSRSEGNYTKLVQARQCICPTMARQWLTKKWSVAQ